MTSLPSCTSSDSCARTDIKSLQSCCHYYVATFCSYDPFIRRKDDDPKPLEDESIKSIAAGHKVAPGQVIEQ